MLIVLTDRFGAGDESSLVVSSLVVSVVPAVDGLSFVEVRGRGFAAIQILQKKRKRNRNVSTSQYKPQRTITKTK